MTVDIARMDTNALAVLGGANDALERLGAWVTAARQAHHLVAGLVDTAFIPDSYRIKVDPRATPEEKAAAREVAISNATAAVLQGVTLGVDPLTALQQIYIVHGRPGMYSKMMVALVQAHGHEVWTEDMSDTRAVVCGRRKGSTVIERITITMDQARKAGWTINQAYTKTPQDMLWARAAGRVCDRIGSDVLKGIASVEEIRDTVQATAETGARTVSPRKRTTAPALAAAEEPPLDEETPAVPEPVVDATVVEDERPAPAPSITAQQQKKLHALLGETGRGDRDTALVWIAGVVGREILTTKDLSKREAGTVIDVLDLEVAGGADADDDEVPL